jgi:hypothetical protein
VQGNELFDRVVALTEVSAVLAPGLVRRALVDGKVEPAAATPAHYLEALPRIRARLKAYVSEAEAERRIAAMETFLHGLPKRRPPAHVDADAFAEDGFDFTTQGRRWTADELAQIKAAQKKAGEGHD